MNDDFYYDGGASYCDNIYKRDQHYTLYTEAVSKDENIEKKEDCDMKNTKTLFHVIMVDDTGFVGIDNKVVANNEEEAKIIAGVYAALQDLEHHTIIVNALGTVKIKVEEER